MESFNTQLIVGDSSRLKGSMVKMFCCLIREMFGTQLPKSCTSSKFIKSIKETLFSMTRTTPMTRSTWILLFAIHGVRSWADMVPTMSCISNPRSARIMSPITIL